jgi:enoyl-CoA hydratase/carnithine racemase
MTRAMLTELGRLWDELECDGSCRAIVLTGAGTRAFTVGADITGDLSAGSEIAPMVNMRCSRPTLMPTQLSRQSTATASAAASNWRAISAARRPRASIRVMLTPVIILNNSPGTHWGRRPKSLTEAGVTVRHA